VRVLALVIAAVVLASGAAASDASARTRGHFEPCAKRGSVAPFDAYWVGSAFRGLKQIDQAYECDRPDWTSPVGTRPDDVTFLYGACGSCSPSLQVQTWPACDRNRTSFGGPLQIGPRPRPVRLRGVPGTDYGDTLDLYTGDLTIAIYSDDRSQLLAAAGAVTRAPRSAMPRAAGRDTVIAARKLAPPVPGHLTGRLDCGASRPRVRIVHARRGAVTLVFRAPERGRVAGEAVTDRRRSEEEQLSQVGEQDFSYRTPAHRPLRRTLRLRSDSPGRHRVHVTFEAPDGRRSAPRTLVYRAR
jgi:hypothetical protein